MTEEDYVTRLEQYAGLHHSIQHTQENKAFFYIEDIDEIEAFDNALRSMKKDICMLFVANDGELDDSGSGNNIDEINGQLYILLRKRHNRDVREINRISKSILIDIVGRLRLELSTKFFIQKLTYQKVGPMRDEWYGHMLFVPIKCPFTFRLDNGNWLDK